MPEPLLLIPELLWPLALAVAWVSGKFEVLGRHTQGMLTIIFVVLIAIR